MVFRRLKSVLLVAFIPVILAFLAWGKESSQQTTGTEGLTLLYTGDSIGYLEPCGCASGQLGGLPRRATAVKLIRQGAKNVLLLSNGNLIQGGRTYEKLKLEVIFAAFKEMRYTAVNVGARDLSFGIETLKRAAEAAEIPLVSANLTHNGKRVFLPYLTFRYALPDQKLQVAVVGLVSPKQAPNLQSVDEAIKVEDPLARLRSILPEFSGRVDHIVLLYQGHPSEAVEMAQTFPKLSVIICSSPEATVRPPTQEGNCWIVNTGQKGQFLGRVSLFPPDAIASTYAQYSTLRLSQEIPDHPVIAELLKGYQTMLEEHLKKGGEVKADEDKITLVGGGVFVGSEKCQSCHRYEYEIWKESKHSHAYATLIEKGHASDLECLKCHTTGYGYDVGFITHAKTPHLENVGCENCHGPGSNHLRTPRKGYGGANAQNCLGCHTTENSPHFNHAQYLRKIAH